LKQLPHLHTIDCASHRHDRFVEALKTEIPHVKIKDTYS
jgi:hypothetical protein